MLLIVRILVFAVLCLIFPANLESRRVERNRIKGQARVASEQWRFQQFSFFSISFNTLRLAFSTGFNRFKSKF